MPNCPKIFMTLCPGELISVPRHLQIMDNVSPSAKLSAPFRNLMFALVCVFFADNIESGPMPQHTAH